MVRAKRSAEVDGVEFRARLRAKTAAILRDLEVRAAVSELEPEVYPVERFAEWYRRRLAAIDAGEPVHVAWFELSREDVTVPERAYGYLLHEDGTFTVPDETTRF